MRDLGYCTPSVTPGHRYRITAWYKSSRPSNFIAFTRDSLGGFYYWATSGDFAAASTWTKATWVTPVIPSGVNGVSFGLAIAAERVRSPSTTSASTTPRPAASPTRRRRPSLLPLPATARQWRAPSRSRRTPRDNTAVDHVDFLVDGTVVGTIPSGVYSYPWDSRTVANGTHTITVRAVDTAGQLDDLGRSHGHGRQLDRQPAPEPVARDCRSAARRPAGCSAGSARTRSRGRERATPTPALSPKKLDVTSFTDGDRKLVNTQDSGACAPAVTPGHTYTVSAYYKSNATARIFAYYRSSAGVWTFWTSTSFPASSTWARASLGLPCRAARRDEPLGRHGPERRRLRHDGRLLALRQRAAWTRSRRRRRSPATAPPRRRDAAPAGTTRPSRSASAPPIRAARG